MAQSMDPGQSHGNPLVAGAFGLFELALIVLVIIGMWKLFTKAGEPGWASIIPIYNIYIICKIVGKPGWWVLLMCIPFIGVIFWILVAIELAKVFGQGAGFGVGIAFLSFIFIPLLGFGDAQYRGRLA